MRERNRFLRGMTVWVGYTQAAVPYQRDSRYAGETKYTLSKMLRFSLDAISSFSHRPLQLATLLGFVISTLAFIAIPVVVVLRILGSYLPGFSALTIVVLLLGGIELIAIGIIGEYVGRIYDEVKGRPLYLVRARRNLPDPGGHHVGDYGPPEHETLSSRSDPLACAFPCLTRPRRWLRCATSCGRPSTAWWRPARSSSGLRSRPSSASWPPLSARVRPSGWATAPTRRRSPCGRWASAPGDDVVVPSFTFYASAEAIPPTGRPAGVL